MDHKFWRRLSGVEDEEDGGTAAAAAAPERTAPPVRCAVVTVSDSISPETDYGGRAVAYAITHHGFPVVRRWIVPAEGKQVEEAVKEIAEDEQVDFAVLIGGMGIGRRDVTYGALARHLEKRLDTFSHVFSWLAFQEVGAAALTERVLCGVIRKAVFVALPKSQALCELAMERLVIPEMARMAAQAKR